MKTLHVGLDDRSYDIHIAPGLLSQAGAPGRAALPRAGRLAHPRAGGAVALPGDLTQVLDVHGPRRVDGDAHDGVGHRFQARQDALGVLIGHDTQDRDEVLEAEGLLDGAREGLDAVGVVGGVDQDRGRGAQDLQAAGTGDRGETVLDNACGHLALTVERLDGRQGQQGVAVGRAGCSLRGRAYCPAGSATRAASSARAFSYCSALGALPCQP